MPSPKTKKIIISLLLIFFVIFSFQPIRAQAQASGLIVVAFTKVWDVMKKIGEKIYDFVRTEAVGSAIQMFSRNFAKQLATDLASGGEGGKPLFYTRPIGQYIEEAAGAGAGDFIGSLSEVTWATLGLNLCDPDLNVKMAIQAGLLEEENPLEPKCEWKDIEKNWNEFSAKMSGGQWTDYIAFSFEPGKSDISSYLLLSEEAEKRKQEKAREAEIERMKSDWKPIKTAITKELKTTGDLIAKEAGALVPKGVLDIGLQTKWSNAYLSKNILAPFLSTFTNTLISKLGERFLKKGFWSMSDVVNQGGGSPGGGSGGGEYFTGGYTQAQASAAFGGLLTPNITAIEDFQQLEDFLFCNLSSPTFGNKLNNCVLEPNFYSALYMDPPITLQEAVSSQYGLINGDLELVSPEDSRNQDLAFCYNQAFCYGNLQKLRQSRIIPIGWEIAAAKSTNTPVTLKEAMDNFNNESSPWYHLVDPNWVLKAPSAQCQANVYSAVLESSQGSSRHQSCVDPMSCIKEKDDGTCEPGAYGRCTKEKNIWRLGGDTCDSWNDTCLSLTKTSDNSTDTYITSSMKTCPSDATGCQWYSTNSAKTLDEWQWQDDPRIYFDDDAKECDAQASGCSQLIRLTSGTNLLYNASLEIDEDNNNYPDGWDIAGSDQYDSQGLNGSMAIKNTTSNQPSYDSTIKIFPNQYYTLSGWAKPIEQSGTLPTPVLFLENQSGNEVGEIISYYGSNAYKAPSDQLKVKADVSEGAAQVNGWYFLSVTFLSNPNEAYPFEVKVYMSAMVATFNDAESWFDNIQLERSQTPTSYYDYGAVNLSYLTKAPDYYQCQGYTKRVPTYEDEITCSAAGFLWRSDIEACVQGGDPLCSSYALYCQEYEDGCQAYTPVNGDPMIPGILKPQDYCPAECLGYQTYEEDPSYFDLVENSSTPSASKNLISTTAQECSSTELNCEEFTNLDEVAQGGEGKEYYTYLRQCVLPDNAGVAAFYTWEGSDTTGFQLKTWDLLESNELYPSETGYGPCTNVNIGVPVADVACQDDTQPIQICSPTMDDTNCREFFDAQGNSHFRLQERTITASEDCHPLRRTESGLDYTAIPQEGISCSQAAAGCRLYRGNTSSNIKIAFSDDFEDGDTQGWEDGIISNESVYLNDHSLKTTGMPQTAVNPSIIANSLTEGKEYQLELIIKKVGSGSTTINPFLFNGGSWTTRTIFGTATTTDDWQQIILGPVELDHSVNSDKESLWISPADDVYIDSVTLKELNNNLYLIKDSWQTPISCDNLIDNPQGEMGGTTGNRTFIGAMLNCQEYEDSNNNTAYLHSFSELCSEEVVGCEAMIDTHNSSSPFEQSFNTSNSSLLDDVTVPEDNYIYIVNNSAMSCFSSEKGCQTLGLPDLNQATSTLPYYIEGYSNISLINNPDEYDSTLCLDEELFCQEYRTGSAGEGYSYYSFYDPGQRLCEYQINKTVGSTPTTGWFMVNSLESCAGGDYTLYPSASPDYEGWVGLCPQEQSGCTKFIDPYASVSDNKIVNPGFENDYDANNIPDYYVESGSGLITYSDTEGINNTKAVQTKYASPDLFYQNISLKAGKLYRISVNAKYETASQDTAELAVADCSNPSDEFAFNSPDYKFTTTTNTAILTLDGLDSDYKEYGGQLGVNEDIVCALYFGGIGSDGAWFDNLFLKEIEPYYYLNNDSLDKQSCSTQTSLKHGCVLFYDTANPELNYNSQASYLLSSSQDEALVNPELCSTGDLGCDANTILKVTRDRACAEWYSCVSSIFITDPLNPSNLKEQCSQLALCNEFTVSSSATGKCTNWVVNENPEILTDTKYENRDVSWGGREYSGYSMYNKYQIDATQVLDTYDPDDEERYRLVVVVGEGNTQYACGMLGENTLNLYSSISPSTYAKAKEVAPWLIPVYSNGLCLLGLDGIGLHCSDISAPIYDCTPYDDYDTWDYAGDSCGTSGTCELGKKVAPRGYASQESPFPFAAWQGNQQYYDKSNICIESQEAFDYLYNVNYMEDNTNDRVLEIDPMPIYPEDPSADGFITDSCEAQYKKVEYGNGIKTMYFGEGVDVPLKVIESDQTGVPDPVDIVYPKTKTTDYINWGGYCLEEDSSRIVNGDQQACLTWLPQDIVAGGLDINNLYTNAGYEPNSDNEYMCLEGKGNWQGSNIAISWNSGGWTPTRYVYSGPTNETIDGDCYDQGSWTEVCGTHFEQTGGNFTCQISDDGVLDSDSWASEWLTGVVDQGTTIYFYGTPTEKSFYKNEIEAIEFRYDPGGFEAGSNGNDGYYSAVRLTRDNNWRCDENNYLTSDCEGMIGWGWGGSCWLKSVQAHWYSSTGKYKELSIRMEDPPGGACSWGQKRLKFYFREPCQVLAQVVDNDEHYAWTNRVWSQSSYTDQYLENYHISTCTQPTPPSYCDDFPNKLSLPFLDYEYGQQNSPGGMVYEGLNDLTPTNQMWYIGDDFSTGDGYNAGSAYSCEGSCSGRMCVGGDDNGDACGTSADCPPDGICVGIQGMGGSSAGSLGITDARERVSQLFAKAFKTYIWDWNSNQYVENNSYVWDITGESTLNGSPGSASNVYHESPFVFAVDGDGTRITNPNNIITVNNFYGSGNLEASVQLMTNIQFYFYSHQSAMPTRKLRINWGDGYSEILEDGYFQNRYAPGECNGNNYGLQLGTTCTESPYQVSHLYSYALAPATGYECDGTGGKPDIPNAKCFKPMVQITDNWGWCNKSGYDTECDNLDSHSAKFQGWIVIYP
jgi:hypothetical protein